MTTIENIYEVMGEGYVTSEVAIELVESLIGNYIPEANTTGELIQKVVTDAINKGVHYDLNKLQLLGGLSTVQQYAGEAGEYTVTQEDKDMLQEQAKVLKENKANLLKRLDKAVSKFNHPLDYHTQVQPIPTNINQVVNHTGGANGSDTSWDKVGREYGFNNHRHLASKGQFMDRSLSRVDLTEQEILFGLNQVNTLLKKDYDNNYVGRLHARNYYQVINSDAVYAVAPITGKSRVSGGTNTAVQVGIKLNKPVYVWDTNTKQWHKYQPILKRFVVYDKPVVLTPNYAGVGTRDIDNKPKGKGQKGNPNYLGDDVRAKALQAMAEVYQNTITAINDRATQANNTDSTLDNVSEDLPHETYIHDDKGVRFGFPTKLLNQVNNIQDILPELRAIHSGEYENAEMNAVWDNIINLVEDVGLNGVLVTHYNDKDLYDVVLKRLNDATTMFANHKSKYIVLSLNSPFSMDIRSKEMIAHELTHLLVPFLTKENYDKLNYIRKEIIKATPDIAKDSALDYMLHGGKSDGNWDEMFTMGITYPDVRYYIQTITMSDGRNALTALQEVFDNQLNAIKTNSDYFQRDVYDIRTNRKLNPRTKSRVGETGRTTQTNSSSQRRGIQARTYQEFQELRRTKQSMGDSTGGNSTSQSEVSSGVLNYEQAKQLINTLSKQDKDKLRDTVAKHLNKDNPSLKQVVEYVMEFGLPSQNLALDTLTEQAIDNLTDDEVSAIYEQNKEAIQELLQQDLLYQLDVSSDFFNKVLSKDTLKELAKLRSDNKIYLSDIRNSALPTTVKQYLTAQLSSMDYKRLTGNQLFKAFNNSYIQHQRIKQLDHELERRLVSMVKSLGYTVSVKTKQELKDKYGLGINGVFSVVQKSIEVVHANERNITTLPEEALHAIIEVANWNDNGSMLNILYEQLHTWSEYPKIYNRYASIYTRNGTPDKDKIHKEIMAQVLSYAITGHKDFKFYSIEYIDDGFVTGILKKFIDLIGRIYDDFTGKGVDRELRRTASIIADYLKEGNLDGIVHSRTTKGNLLNVENTLAHQRTIDNGFGEKLIQDISSLGGVITGSFGLRYFNSIFREAKDSLHDIDLYLDIKKELKATRYMSLRHDEFEDTNFFKELSKQYPHLSFAASFGEVYSNQIYQYVVTKDTQTKALIDQAIEQLKSQRKRVGIDTITELLPEDKVNQFYWLDIFIGYDIPNTFDSKLGMNFVSYERGIAEKNALGRSKDANDYMNSHAMDTGNYIDSYFQVDETEIEYKRRILKEAVRKLHNPSFDNGQEQSLVNKSAGEVTVIQTLNQYLISKALEVNPTLKIESKSYPEGNFGGEYVPSTNTIYINDKLTGDKYYTALNHELYHALTETGLTKDTQAGRELKKIYEHLKSLNSNWVHELENINEFVAYAMTDKAFMDWVLANTNLQQLGIKPRTTNKLKAFINIVLSVFGFNQSNQTLDTLVSLIDETMITYDPNSIGDTPVRNVMYSDATSQVNGMNVSDVFKDLPTNVSQAHNEHLDKVIDNIIGTYGNTHQRKLANIANGKLRNTSLLNGFKSSDKEAYITDALIIVFESYLKAHTGNMAVNGLNNLYRDAIKQYASVKDLFPNFATASKEDKAQMVKMYNFIFNNKTKQDNVARFMAMTLANEQFRQLMQSGRKPMRDNATWFDKAMRVLDKVVNWFNRVYFWSKSNKHSDIIDAMTKRLVDLDIKARNTSVDWLQVGWTNTLEFTGKALDKPVKKLGYLLMDKVIKQFAGSKGKLGTLGSIAKLQSDVKTLKDLEKENAELDGEIPLHESVVNRLLSKTYGDERYKIIRDTINEVTMYGKRGKWIENMVRLTQSIGKVRQAMKESTIRVFDEVFETPLTKEQKSDITKVVLRTELSSLVRHGFSIEKVASMFEQVTLNKTIDNYAKQLIKKVGYTKANDMLMQSKALGYYMAKESTVRNMTKSAQGIAIGLGTDYQTDFSNMDNDVFMLVDVLSTLYALDYTDKSARQSVKALLENEPLAMNTVLQLQKGLVDKGRDEFEHNPLNYQKGYTPQITNPYRKLIWVTTPDEIKMLKAQGFEEVTKLTKDKLDDTDQRTLILHTAYSPNNYVSGGLDLADSHARGTTVYKQGINDREIAKVTKANIAMRKQRNQGSYMNYDPNVDRNAMVATYATDGAILDYHYEMEGNTRDIYLERDNSFDELMGTLHGNLEFKPQIREHQANIAKEIFREAKATFAKNPNEFVLLDFDNPDPVVQETMKLLPYSFRKEIIKHFGDGVVPVHKSVYTSMFGFRAYSIANMFDKLHDPEQKLNRAEKLITGIFIAFSKEKARHRTVQLEKLIQDFMFVIKDYIVIRSGGVLMGNIISNILLLSLHG